MDDNVLNEIVEVVEAPQTKPQIIKKGGKVPFQTIGLSALSAFTSWSVITGCEWVKNKINERKERKEIKKEIKERKEAKQKKNSGVSTL